MPSSDLVALVFSPVSPFVTKSFAVLALTTFPVEVTIFVFLVVDVNAVPFFTASIFSFNSFFTVSTLIFFVIVETSSFSGGASACFAAIGFSLISDIVYFTLIVSYVPVCLGTITLPFCVYCILVKKL